MNFLVRASERYPKAKQTKHKGDSYLIYEAGGRDPLDPFGSKTFDKKVDEVEGPGAAKKAKDEVEGKKPLPPKVLS